MRFKRNQLSQTLINISSKTFPLMTSLFLWF